MQSPQLWIPFAVGFQAPVANPACHAENACQGLPWGTAFLESEIIIVLNEIF